VGQSLFRIEGGKAGFVDARMNSLFDHGFMFTGIIEEAGIVERIDRGKEAIRLTLRSEICAQDLKMGDSLAVNGCCLTVVEIIGLARGKLLVFDLLEETWTRTNLQFLVPEHRVNLERPVRADSRLGGHFVTGHIDGMGEITRWESSGKDYLLEVAAPPEVARYLIFKGSIAVDGISLTVADLAGEKFRVWIIPHTCEVTALRERKVGDRVNLEADILGKYVEKMLTKK
jgi:riboflavin synthase